MSIEGGILYVKRLGPHTKCVQTEPLWILSPLENRNCRISKDPENATSDAAFRTNDSKLLKSLPSKNRRDSEVATLHLDLCLPEEFEGVDALILQTNHEIGQTIEELETSLVACLAGNLHK